MNSDDLNIGQGVVDWGSIPDYAALVPITKPGPVAPVPQVVSAQQAADDLAKIRKGGRGTILIPVESVKLFSGHLHRWLKTQNIDLNGRYTKVVVRAALGTKRDLFDARNILSSEVALLLAGNGLVSRTTVVTLSQILISELWQSGEPQEARKLIQNLEPVLGPWLGWDKRLWALSHAGLPDLYALNPIAWEALNTKSALGFVIYGNRSKVVDRKTGVLCGPLGLEIDPQATPQHSWVVFKPLPAGCKGKVFIDKMCGKDAELLAKALEQCVWIGKPKSQPPLLSEKMMTRCRTELLAKDYGGADGWAKFAGEMGISQKSARLAARSILSDGDYLKLGWCQRINKPADIGQRLKAFIKDKTMHGEEGQKKAAKVLGMSVFNVYRTGKKYLSPIQFLKLQWTEKVHLPADFKAQLEAGIADGNLFGDQGLRRLAFRLGVDAQWVRRRARDVLEAEKFRLLNWSSISRDRRLKRWFRSGILTQTLIGIKGWNDFAAKLGVSRKYARVLARQYLSPDDFMKLGWFLRTDGRKFEEMVIAAMSRVDERGVEEEFGSLIFDLSSRYPQVNPVEARDLAVHVVRFAVARWRLSDQKMSVLEFVSEKSASQLRQIMRSRVDDSTRSANASRKNDFNPVDLVTSGSNPEAEVMEREESIQIEDALSLLDPASRLLLEMVFYDDMSLGEAAENMDWDLARANEIYQHALAALRNRLQTSPKKMAAKKPVTPVAVKAAPTLLYSASTGMLVKKPVEAARTAVKIQAADSIHKRFLGTVAPGFPALRMGRVFTLPNTSPVPRK